MPLDPTSISLLFEQGGLSLILIAGMGAGLVQIGRYIAAEREKDRTEKERLAATFSGGIKDIMDKHDSTVKVLATEFRDEIRAARAEAKDTTTQLLTAIHHLDSLRSEVSKR